MRPGFEPMKLSSPEPKRIDALFILDSGFAIWGSVNESAPYEININFRNSILPFVLFSNSSEVPIYVETTKPYTRIQ